MIDSTEMFSSANLRELMTEGIRRLLETRVDFSIFEICEECNLNHEEYHGRMYQVILQWRESAQAIFTEYCVPGRQAMSDGKEVFWDSFLEKMNSENVFLLYAYRGPNAKYYQPSWFDKIAKDFGKLQGHISRQVDVLCEMDHYGESFPKYTGIGASPRDIVFELNNVMIRQGSMLDEYATAKIKQLEGEIGSLALAV